MTILMTGGDRPLGGWDFEDPPCWCPEDDAPDCDPCDEFVNDDQGVCIKCGHEWACHEYP